MTKKAALGVAGICALVAAGLLVGQVGDSQEPIGPQVARTRPAVVRPRRRPAGPRPDSSQRQWLDNLEQAYQAQDMDRIGKLIEQMKQQPGRFQPHWGGPGFGGPPPHMRGGGIQPMGFPVTAFDIEEGDLTATGQAQGRTEAETQILAVLDEMSWSQRGPMESVSVADGRLLRLLTEATGARQVVEIGTSDGCWALWLCLALRTTGGKLTILEADVERAVAAREVFETAGVVDVVTLVEGDIREEAAQWSGPIDIVFLNAGQDDHIDYLNELLPSVRAGGLVVARNSGQTDSEFVRAVTTDPNLETVFYSLGGGISITMKKYAEP